MAIWDKLGRSGNVEDRRGTESSLLPFGLGSGVLTTGVVLILGVLGYNVDPTLVDQLIQLSGVTSTTTQTEQPAEFKGVDDYEAFASAVLGSTNQYWKSALKGTSTSYIDPRLVLFRDSTSSGCGIATADVGPHYCPADQTIYLDETFFDVLKERLGGSNGDVAQAYVLAHEVGHHVQHLTGTMASIQNDPEYQTTGANSLSVRLELQADCYAGLWANSIRDRGVFENDQEINEALDAAAAVGDDRIQSSSGGVNPETWTHGSSEQRTSAFKAGWSSGDLGRCSL